MDRLTRFLTSVYFINKHFLQLTQSAMDMTELELYATVFSSMDLKGSWQNISPMIGCDHAGLKEDLNMLEIDLVLSKVTLSSVDHTA
jgi:hypothetical protein